MTTDILPEGFDFTDPDVNWEAIPHEQFAALRMTAPVHWVEQPPEARSGIAPEAGTGYWAVTKHADVAAVSKDSKNWSSAENGAIIRYGREIERADVELQRVILLNQDPPEHTGTRHIISRGFTPRNPKHWPVLARSAGALFIRSYERGERVHLAMLSRGYTGKMPR